MKQVTADEVTAALAALRQFPVLDGRVTPLHARAALEAGLMGAAINNVEALHDRSDEFATRCRIAARQLRMSPGYAGAHDAADMLLKELEAIFAAASHPPATV